MAVDHIRYDILAQAALRGVVRTVLADAAKKGLPGEHHFKITFNTAAPNVRLSDRMRAQYPSEMTIVLQHQFWDLAVSDEAFEVGLSFGGVPELIAIPFDAVTAFYDPAVQFGFQFETIESEGAADQEVAQEKAGQEKAVQDKSASAPARLPASPAPASALPAPGAATSEESGAPDTGAPVSGAEVVRLDRFRKK